MDHPERLLTTLFTRLLALRSASAYLGDAELFDPDLLKLIRKVKVAARLAERFSIAVTGSQSAGKTLLMRNLYDLDTTWLEDNRGRGEKVPLLVLEKPGISEPEGYVEVLVETEGTEKLNPPVLRQQPATAEEFKRVLQGLEPLQLLPILYVPTRYFHGANVGFLLLPGFETEDEANADWQHLMRHALHGASASVVVTHETRLAQYSQEEIAANLGQHFVHGPAPIIAISRTEDLEESERETLRTRAAEVFGVPLDQQNRIVCIGKGDAASRSAWTEALIDAIDNYSASFTDTRNRQLGYLDGLLSSDLSAILIQIKDAMSQETLALTPEARLRDELLAELDKHSIRLKGIYLKELGKALSTHANAAVSRGKQRYGETEEGIKNIPGKVRRWMALSAGEREQARVDDIKSHWNEAGKPETHFRHTHLTLLDRLVQSELRIQGSNVDRGDASPRTAMLPAGERNVPAEPAEATVLTPKVQSAMRSLFIDQRGAAQPLSLAEKNELKRAIAAMPALTLEFVRLTELHLSEPVHTSLPGTTQGDLRDALEKVGKTVTDLGHAHSAIIKGIAAILAIDFAADGEIDTIPALFEAIAKLLSATGLIEAGAGASLALSAAGVLAVGFLAYGVVDHLQRLDAANRGYIATVLGAIRDAHYQRYQDVFEELMGRLRDTLEARLNLRYRLDEHLGARDGLMRALAEVRSVRTDMLEAIRGNSALA
jgi:hypothetical protein